MVPFSSKQGKVIFMSNLSYKTYSQIISMVFEEELERLKDYLKHIQSGEDVMDDKLWTAEVDAPPSFAEVQAFLPKVEGYSLEDITAMVADQDLEEEDYQNLADAIHLAYMEA